MTSLIDLSKLEPAMRQAYDFEARLEANRRAAHNAEVMKTRGVCRSGMGPGPFKGRLPAEILALAERRLTEQREFEKTAEGRVMLALEQADEIVMRAHILIEQARAARSRSFIGEVHRIDAHMQRLEEMGRQLVSASLDAQIVTGEACGALEPREPSLDDHAMWPVVEAIAQAAGARQ